MNDAECLHGLDPRWCAACKDPAPNPHAEKPAPTVVATFRARYPGECGPCGFAIAVGQVVHKRSDETYVHGGCQ